MRCLILFFLIFHGISFSQNFTLSGYLEMVLSYVTNVDELDAIHRLWTNKFACSKFADTAPVAWRIAAPTRMPMQLTRLNVSSDIRSLTIGQVRRLMMIAEAKIRGVSDKIRARKKEDVQYRSADEH